MPGTFNRLLTMAEEAQRAQIQTVTRAQEFARRDTRRGQMLGFVVTLCAMGGAIWCALLHEPVVAGIFLGVPVMAVAKALIESTRKQLPSAPVQVQPSESPMTPTQPQ